MIKVNSEADKVCVAKAREAGQEHLFEGWDELSQDDQRGLLRDLRSINFPLVKRLLHQRRQGQDPDLDLGMLTPPEVQALPAGPAGANGNGTGGSFPAAEAALGEGKIALFLLAGGTGLGSLGEPTGMLPVGPISGNSLFQLHAEKIRALNRQHKISLPLHIMIHPDHLETTSEFFKSENHFGLNPSDVHFVPQPLLPLIDRRGRFLRTEPGKLALSPNGHGGVLDDYLDSAGAETLRESGIEHLFLFQVDNPLVQIGDAAFLDHHISGGYEVSSKCIDRAEGEENLGVFCRIGETTGVISYSRLPEQEEAGGWRTGAWASAAEIWRLISSSWTSSPEFTPRTCSFPSIQRRRPYPSSTGRESWCGRPSQTASSSAATSTMLSGPRKKTVSSTPTGTPSSLRSGTWEVRAHRFRPNGTCRSSTRPGSSVAGWNSPGRPGTSRRQSKSHRSTR